MNRRACAALALFAALSPAADEARPAPKEHPAHDELRALRDHVMDAFNKGDIDRLIEYTHKNVVCTWQNGEVSRGHDGLRAYYQRMMTGEHRVVQSVQGKAEVDDLTILYGDDNGLAFGSLAEDFTLTDGRQFRLDNRWTAYLVKQDGRWQIAGLHVSADVFHNPILNMAVTKTAWWVGGGAGLAVLLLGVVIGRLLGRRSSPRAA